MRKPAPTELLLLPEREAADRFLDGRTEAALRWLAGLFVVTAVVTAIAAGANGLPLLLAMAGGSLAASGVVLLGRGSRLLTENVRVVAVGFVLVQFALAALSGGHTAVVATLAVAIFPLLQLVLPLPASHHLLLAAAFAGTAAWAVAWGGGEAPEGSIVGRVAGVLVPVATLAGGAIALTRRRRRRFVEFWRREAPVERERRRMRDELADARKIQLGMLPPAAPELAWLDLASVSLPATEVGGDYFDFFPLNGEGLAVVIGDVAGHGVGSGLVLSGVKSGLHLLRDRMVAPVEVVDRLNGMVRDAMRWRMFVTLLVAVLDPAARRLRTVSAGHPPLLHWSAAAGEVREVAVGAPPLGTRLPHEFEEVGAPLAAGDLVLFYTDGLTEVRSLAGEPYGDVRLRRELARAASLPSAAKVRDALLHALSNFKGDAPQEDDLTMVVARVRAVGGAA